MAVAHRIAAGKKELKAVAAGGEAVRFRSAWTAQGRG